MGQRECEKPIGSTDGLLCAQIILRLLQSTVSRTSTLPRVAFEYGQT
jgi:hypothetical protein